MRDEPMETIQIQVSADLAELLRPHYDELPLILEWGLRCLEEAEPWCTTVPAEAPQREKVFTALHSTGILVQMDPVIAARYRSLADRPRRTPIHVPGKPLSEMIVEERDRRGTNSR